MRLQSGGSDFGIPRGECESARCCYISEREGEQTDRALLKNVLDISIEIGMGQMEYYHAQRYNIVLFTQDFKLDLRRFLYRVFVRKVIELDDKYLAYVNGRDFLLFFGFLLATKNLDKLYNGWSRKWGEEHFGNGKVHKYGKSTMGKSWDIVLDEEIY
ncbi:hypothetical protein Tco_1266605, partial [Tanacetum coccineum]